MSPHPRAASVSQPSRASAYETSLWTHSANGQSLVQIDGAELSQKGPTRRVVAKNVITCAGLHADTVATLADGESNPKVPCAPPILRLIGADI